jgi:hypothetical protein
VLAILVLVKNTGTNQGFLPTSLPFTNKSYIIYINNNVATTETIDPKLDTAFQPSKASG